MAKPREAKKKKLGPHAFINRELSWLEFNRRVLEEARDPSVPLLERLKFLAITGSNLDEFFMVRVGGLQLMRAEGRSQRDASGLTPTQQMERISRYARRMVADQYTCLITELEPALHEARIRRVHMDDLDAEQAAHVDRLFEELFFPVLTPRAIDPDKPFPHLAALTIHLAVRLAHQPDQESETRMAVIPMPGNLARFVTVPIEDGYEYVLLEDVIQAYAERLFPGEIIEELCVFRITRNADMRVREDEAPDLMAGMEDILEERLTSPCVRLEIGPGASNAMIEYLERAFNVEASHVMLAPGPLDLKAYMSIATMAGFDEYKCEPWPPQLRPDLAAPESMFDILSSRNVLLYHPYDSFEPVMRLLDEAADDPGVLAIKQILYRTSSQSPIVAALARAAQKGKHVTALVELKARFDEARNIEWAKALETAGVQVVYGVRGFKTHAKVCLIIRREASGIRRYLHFGTGNYNESTARLYTDISYMMCDEDYGADAATFFNTITGYAQAVQYRKIEAAPLGLRARLLEGIENEIERCNQGQKAHIMAKVNSLVDPTLIKALYRASQAGVRVDLNVRGICCLRPGVPGLSEHIRVVSIVDRFLEHPRIVYFKHGDDPLYFISSADWMSRNLDKRIELLVPVEDPAAQQRLREILETCFKDNVKSWELTSDGHYERSAQRGKQKRVRSQEVFYERARQTVKEMEQHQRTLFKPHLPSG